MRMNKSFLSDSHITVFCTSFEASKVYIATICGYLVCIVMSFEAEFFWGVSYFLYEYNAHLQFHGKLIK
jgi:hypothetical protein